MSLGDLKFAVNSTIGTDRLKELDRIVNTDPIYPLNVIAQSETILNNMNREILEMTWRRGYDIGLTVDRIGGYGQPQDLLEVKNIEEFTTGTFREYIAPNSLLFNQWLSLNLPWRNPIVSDKRLFAEIELVFSANASRAATRQAGTVAHSYSTRYGVGVLRPDGKIDLFPQATGQILTFDPLTNIFANEYPTNVPSLYDACYADNGMIYAIENTSNAAIWKIDFSQKTVQKLTATIAQSGNLIYAPNGYIYIIPNQSNSHPIGLFNPETETISTFGSISGCAKGVLGYNGKIYCVPNTATTINVIQTTNNTISSFGSLAGGTNQYYTGVLADSTKIIMPPGTATSVGVINITSDTFTTEGSNISTNYISAAVGVDGQVYCVPKATTAQPVGWMNPKTPGVIATFGSILANSIGAILAPNGRIYVFVDNISGRSNSNYITSITNTGFEPLPLLGLLSPYLNRF